MVVWYKNSFLASAISIFGCGLIMCGVAMLFESEPAGGVAIAVIGLAMAFWGRSISKNKAFKKWWKEVITKIPVAHIAQDVNLAIHLYNQNPDKRTLRKLEELNPTAAQIIRQSQVKK